MKKSLIITSIFFILSSCQLTDMKELPTKEELAHNVRYIYLDNDVSNEYVFYLVLKTFRSNFNSNYNSGCTIGACQGRIIYWNEISGILDARLEWDGNINYTLLNGNIALPDCSGTYKIHTSITTIIKSGIFNCLK
jgi:hypothetical protein